MAKFEMNGTIYESNDKGNYFYKSTGKVDKKGNPIMVRISQKIWDEAWEASGEAEKAKREAEQASKDAEAEKKFNKTKKASKPRRSKDIAFELKENGQSVVTLTAKQVNFIKAMPDDDFYERGLESTLWIDVFCDTIADQFSPMAVGAMVSTLREKGLIFVDMQKVNGKKAKYFGLTKLGQRVAKALGLN